MNVLVISPHPDDETLGAGGTLLKFKDSGHRLFWIIVTNMKTEYGYSAERVNERNKEIEEVDRAYGFEKMWNLEMEPAGVDKYEKGELVAGFKKILDEVQPEILIIPYRFDVHSDHRIIFEAVYSCTKAFRAPYLKTVMSMEILSETDQAQVENVFSPNVFVDISEYIDKKIDVMRIYKSEIDEAPFPRNENAIRGMAAFRGATAYQKYSEAFYLIKSRID
ncbi:PIG-L deacetylase family protein [Butyrivibrio sp. MB2005]|uniref:PIG-L deacetylase family protein n=1 Tax=Butyrivibrio sp. MB2005 TaxID=1280678 RepID=UPI00040982FA|nr:PIG-L deacetylase family protein [Butyrivibrio sp. MB2005]